jgi:hypothetical protein
MVTPATTAAAKDMLSGLFNKIIIKRRGPRNRPNLCLVPCFTLYINKIIVYKSSEILPIST